ncbi:MAG TPA: tetratricopeptide repeat protein [Deltaproteobacteria bacterium]|nr:tetratricopeptide repeat protein [Deltaproteobacteria bacterium]
MKVVFYLVVKKVHTQNIMRTWICSLFLLTIQMCCNLASSAWANTLQVGGAPERARVIFEMERATTPVLTQKDQTLIVNFPNTIGPPAMVSDTFIIRELTFDGKTAQILMKKPFIYNTTLMDRPPRFIIDIKAEKEASGYVCPIEDIETNPTDNGITVTIFMSPGAWPEIRDSENKRTYLFFNHDISCMDIEKPLSRVPYIEYSGTIKTQNGMGMIFSVIDENASMEIISDEINNKIVLEIVTTEEMNRSKIYDIAKRAFEIGDIAAAIHTLERYKDTLDAKENVLLGRAYWKVSYPYRMESFSMEALKRFSDGIQAMSPGIERERIMLEYNRMLLRSDMPNETVKYIRFLKDSTSATIAMEANVQEIDMMNRKGLFEDAFVENTRMGMIFNMDSAPVEIKGYYLSVIADTYLGLNAYAKAIRLYQDAFQKDPTLFRYDPELYSRIAQASYNMKDYAEAKQYLLLAINLGSPETKATSLLHLGDCLYQMGQNNKAMEIFSEVENIGPRSDTGIIAKLRTARILLEQDLKKDGELTDRTFYEIIDIYETMKSTDEYQEGPLGSLVKIRIAQTYSIKGEWENALKAYHRAWMDTKKTDPIHQYAQAEAEKTILSRLHKLYQEEDFDSIYNLFIEYETSFMSDIRDSDFLFIMGDTMYHLGKADLARTMLTASADKDTARRAPAIATLFTMDYQSGDYASALMWNSLYLKDYPRGVAAGDMKQTRGRLLYFMNKPEEAVVFLEPVSEKEDENALDAMSMLADIYKKLHRKPEEIRTLERIIALNKLKTSPIIALALYTRARQLISDDDLDRAGSLLQELSDTYPQSKYKNWALYHLATIAHTQDNHTKARDILAEVVQDSTDSILINTATTYLKEMDLYNDIAEFNKLKNRFGGN